MSIEPLKYESPARRRKRLEAKRRRENRRGSGVLQPVRKKTRFQNGDVLGRWTILGERFKRGTNSYVKLKCRCGQLKVMSLAALSSGRFKDRCKKCQKRKHLKLDDAFKATWNRVKRTGCCILWHHEKVFHKWWLANARPEYLRRYDRKYPHSPENSFAAYQPETPGCRIRYGTLSLTKVDWSRVLKVSPIRGYVIFRQKPIQQVLEERGISEELAKERLQNYFMPYRLRKKKLLKQRAKERDSARRVREKRRKRSLGLN